MHSDGKSKAWAKQGSGGSRKQTARTQERRAGAGNWTLCFCLAFSRDVLKRRRQKTLSWKNKRMGNNTGAWGRAFRTDDCQDTFINIITNEENLVRVSLKYISAMECAQTIIASRWLQVVMSFAQSSSSLRFCFQQRIPNSSHMAYDGREQMLRQIWNADMQTLGNWPREHCSCSKFVRLSLRAKVHQSWVNLRKISSRSQLPTKSPSNHNHKRQSVQTRQCRRPLLLVKLCHRHLSALNLKCLCSIMGFYVLPQFHSGVQRWIVSAPHLLLHLSMLLVEIQGEY